MTTPYSDLPPERYWRTGVAGAHPTSLKNLYTKKFTLSPDDRIVTAGSCFAQHVARRLKGAGYGVVDAEPPPFVTSDAVARRYGYLVYSGRYGNVYTARQLRQLVEDARNGAVRAEDVWEKTGRFYDAIRPSVEPNGLASVKEVAEHRRQHLVALDRMFREADVLVFTLGLTEAWTHLKSGTVYPTCPGVLAGRFDDRSHAFRNFDVVETIEDMRAVYALLSKGKPNFRMILTVSPVPLTATASDDHVLVATTYSKSVLRAACGSMAKAFANVDYFPSYELITAPVSRGFFYEPNLREVTELGVETAMAAFFDQHADVAPEETTSGEALRQGRRAGAGKLKRRGERRKARAAATDVVCEEILLEAFAKR